MYAHIDSLDESCRIYAKWLAPKHDLPPKVLLYFGSDVVIHLTVGELHDLELAVQVAFLDQPEAPVGPHAQ
jgi:hypothetical protein